MSVYFNDYVEPVQKHSAYDIGTHISFLGASFNKKTFFVNAIESIEQKLTVNIQPAMA